MRQWRLDLSLAAIVLTVMGSRLTRVPGSLRVVFLALACVACSGSPTPNDAAAEAAAPCFTHADCDDGSFCNGPETCAPGAAGADPRGCSLGQSPCLATQFCDAASRLCITECATTRDADNDGHAAVNCGGDDCDDADGARFPGNVEECDAAHDEDCDPMTVGLRDTDDDGYDSAACCNARDILAPVCGPDCDDGRAASHPGATETCNDVDDDCDTHLDEGAILAGFVDADRDGAGDDARPLEACPGTSEFATTGGDCDDALPQRRPGQVEICDSADNDCDANVDEGATAITWYRDKDEDGFGDVENPSAPSCAPPMGYVLLPLDCDDGRREYRPGAPELCNGRDDDCDDHTDERACSLPDGGVVNPSVDAGVDGGFVDPCEPCMWRYACRTECDDPVRLAVGVSHTCVLTEQGSVYCWGGNYAGQCGVPGSPAYAMPMKVTLPARAAQVTSGNAFSCARLVDGRALCWGVGDEGQLGDGQSTHEDCGGSDCATTPVQVALPGGTRAVEIGAGDRFACARLDDGTVACWGGNGTGELGIGAATAGSSSPLRVVSPSDETGNLVGAISLAVGFQNACVIRAVGQTWCWGQNDRDQLGDGAGNVARRPTVWRSDAAMAWIDVGWSQVCGGTTGGALLCFGDNREGQLGSGSTSPDWSGVPVTLAWGQGARGATGGVRHRCVRGGDARVRCVGSDEEGSLGDGPTLHTTVCASSVTCSVTPVAVTLGTVSDVDTGGTHTCAIAADGVYCWGPNGGGDPSANTPAFAPVRVEGP